MEYIFGFSIGVGLILMGLIVLNIDRALRIIWNRQNQLADFILRLIEQMPKAKERFPDQINEIDGFIMGEVLRKNKKMN